MLNLDLFHTFLWLWVGRLSEYLTDIGKVLPFLTNLLFPLQFRYVVDHEFAPSSETGLVEHSSQEGVHWGSPQGSEERLLLLLLIHCTTVYGHLREFTHAILGH